MSHHNFLALKAKTRAHALGHKLTAWTWITRYSGYARCIICGRSVDVDDLMEPEITGPAIHYACPGTPDRAREFDETYGDDK